MTDNTEREIQDNLLVIRAKKCPRADWAAAFQQMAAQGDDHLLGDDVIWDEGEEAEWE